jgi:hypothetical protein
MGIRIVLVATLAALVLAGCAKKEAPVDVAAEAPAGDSTDAADAAGDAATAADDVAAAAGDAADTPGDAVDAGAAAGAAGDTVGDAALRAVDSILAKLALANIAFNVPETINVHDTALIQLKLSQQTSIDDLKQRITAAGAKEGAQIRVSDAMEARLTGSEFAITAITPERQAVSQKEDTEWKWEVKPTGRGPHSLHLTVSAIVYINGESTPRTILSFDKVIEVEVTWLQRAGSFVDENWQWLWATFLIPLAGLLWNRKPIRRLRRRLQPR